MTSSASMQRSTQRKWQATFGPDVLLVVTLVFIALVPRLILHVQAPVFYSPDSSGYIEPAYDLLTGQGFTGRLKRPVGYPLLLAGTFAVFGLQLTAATLLNHFLGLLTACLTYFVGRECFNRWVGFGAAALVAISGPQLAYERFPIPEAAFTLLIVALALALMAAARATGFMSALLTGALLGAAVLVKPVAQTLLPVALILASLRPGTARQRLASASCMAAAFAIVVLPWTLRNLTTYGRLSPGGAPGETLLARTLQHSREVFAFDAPNVAAESDPARATVQRIIREGAGRGDRAGAVRDRIRQELGLGEEETDRLLQQVTVAEIQRQPLEFMGSIPPFVVRLYEVKGSWLTQLREDDRTWKRHPLAGYLEETASPPAAEIGRRQAQAVLDLYRPGGFGLLLPALALLGLAASWRLRPLAPGVVVGIVWLYLVLVHVALNGPVVRYRYVTEPFVDILALGAVWTGMSYVVPRVRRAIDSVGLGIHVQNRRV
jgi:4-amino-4-deoxy-L-arabinose transferase-like glycosyltransferase